MDAADLNDMHLRKPHTCLYSVANALMNKAIVNINSSVKTSTMVIVNSLAKTNLHILHRKARYRYNLLDLDSRTSTLRSWMEDPLIFRGRGSRQAPFQRFATKVGLKTRCNKNIA